MTASDAPKSDEAKPDSSELSSTKAPDLSGLSFEQALKKLEGIVERLEAGNVPLEESIEIYTEGDALRKHCEGLLKSAEAKVEKIVVGKNGEAEATEPLDVD